jgi:hypothetical protein
VKNMLSETCRVSDKLTAHGINPMDAVVMLTELFIEFESYPLDRKPIDPPPEIMKLGPAEVVEEVWSLFYGAYNGIFDEPEAESM